jgi:hypothetical protein
MLEIIAGPDGNDCGSPYVCDALVTWCDEELNPASPISYKSDKMPELFTEFGAQKPRDAHLIWWPSEQLQPRLRALEKAIALVKQNSLTSKLQSI